MRYSTLSNGECRWLAVIAVLSSCLFLSACSTRLHLPGSDGEAEQLAMALESSGYKSPRSFEIASVHEIWKHAQGDIDVVMTAPTESGRYPLIIYQPSLGEDANAGRLWREAWAKAGYAVFSMQPVAMSQALKQLAPERRRQADDSSWALGGLLSSDKEKAKLRAARVARQSELRYLGHQYFAVDALKVRMEQLLWGYQQVKIRAGLKQPLFAAAAVDQVILAGYDLGAQTVAAALGEDFKTTLPNLSELKPLAAIMLSPSVDSAEGKANKRFQALQLPMLAITGIEDNDPYGISAVALRSVIWEASPPGDKFLLSLKGGWHPLLSGSNKDGYFKPGFDDDDAEEAEIGNPEAASQLQEFGSNQLGDHSRAGGPGIHAGPHFRDGGNPRQAEMIYKQLAAIISSSLAFLDATVKKDEFSRFWLQEKANPWLERAGILKSR